MTIGSWYVLCRRERLTALADLAEQLSAVRDARVMKLDVDYAEIVVDDALTHDSATIRLFVDDDPHILTESQEFAQPYRGRPDGEVIASADVRYAITWDLEKSDETYNARCVIGEVIARATDGVVYDLMEGRIVWSATP